MKTKSIYLAIVFVLLCTNASAQWVQTNGPYGGGVECFAVSGTNLFAGCGGVFLSSNNGGNWITAGPSLPANTGVTALAVLGTNLFAGTWDGSIFRSADNGTSWGMAYTGGSPDNNRVTSFAVIGTNIFAGTAESGVLRFSDNGTNWTMVHNGMPDVNVNALAVSGTNLFAGTTGGVFLSTDSGAKWTSLSTAYVISLAVCGTNLFVGTGFLLRPDPIPNFGGSVMLSTDNGTSWTQAGIGLPNTRFYCFAVNGTNFFAGSDSGLFRSTDNGAVWTAVNTGRGCLGVHSIFVNDTNLFAGTAGGGVYLSTNNGTSWTSASTGLIPITVSSLCVTPPWGESDGNTLFAGTQFGIFRSTNDGEKWEGTSTGLTDPHIYSLAVSGKYVFAGTGGFPYGVGVFLSTDNGASWNATGLDNVQVNALAVSPGSGEGGGTNIFAGGTGFFRSTDNGTSWTSANTGLTDSPVYSLAVIGRNLFAGTEYGGVFLSTNDGTSWTSASTGLPSPQPDVFSLAVSDTNLFAGTRGGVFRSTDNGSSWAPPGDSVSLVLSLAASGTNLFAGTTSGAVYLSSNDGTSWTEVRTAYWNYNYVYSLAVSGTNLFAGTGYAGVWKRPLAEMITSVKPLGIGSPQEIFLDQNYPNPFNPSTTIKFGLPKSSEVRLTVYDILGREVSVLANDRRDAGAHEVKFDGSNLASGVYFYRLQAGNYIATKKLLLMK